jgi:hypothetical protein
VTHSKDVRPCSVTKPAAQDATERDQGEVANMGFTRTRGARSMRRTAAMGLMGLGVACFVPVVAADRASAWVGSCFDYAPEGRPWTEMVVRIDTADLTQLTGAGQSFSDGSLTVTLSGPTPADGALPLSTTNVGSVDFSAIPGVDAAYVRAGAFDDLMYTYYPPSPVTSGTGLQSASGTTPIEWVSFCYVPVSSQATTTTTTTTPSTTAAPIVAPEVTRAPPTSAAPAQVLGQVETAPTLAFTGAGSTTLLVSGVTLLVSGAALLAVSRRTEQRARA